MKFQSTGTSLIYLFAISCAFLMRPLFAQNIPETEDPLGDTERSFMCVECCLSAGDNESEKEQCRQMFGCLCKLNPEGPETCFGAVAMENSGFSLVENMTYVALALRVRTLLLQQPGGKEIEKIFSKHRKRLASLTVKHNKIRTMTTGFLENNTAALHGIRLGEGVVSDSSVSELRSLLLAISDADKGRLAKDLRTEVIPRLNKKLVNRPYRDALKCFASRPCSL